MAPPANSIKTIVSGTLASGEQFAFGWQAQANSDDAQFALTNYQGVAVGAVTGNLLTTAVLALLPATTAFTLVTSYLYKGGTGAAFTAQTPITGKVGTAAASGMPNQCAEVVSLLTGVPGRSTRGRAYFPGLAVGNLTPGTAQLAGSACTTLANAFAAMLSSIKDSTGGRTPVVASSTHGLMTPITLVSVDTVVDTQRRRRDKSIPTARPSAAVT